MDKDLVQGNLGSVGKYDVSFKGGMLIVSLEAGADGVTGNVAIQVNAAIILDALKAAIPGKIDDAVIDLAKAALLA